MTEEEYLEQMREQQEWSERCEAADADEWERIKKLTADEINAELDARGISTVHAVSHVLAMVRDAKAKQRRRRVERN